MTAKYKVGDKLNAPEGSILWGEGFRDTFEIVEVDPDDKYCSYRIIGTRDGKNWVGGSWRKTHGVDECILVEVEVFIEWEED